MIWSTPLKISDKISNAIHNKFGSLTSKNNARLESFYERGAILFAFPTNKTFTRFFVSLDDGKRVLSSGWTGQNSISRFGYNMKGDRVLSRQQGRNSNLYAEFGDADLYSFKIADLSEALELVKLLLAR